MTVLSMVVCRITRYDRVHIEKATMLVIALVQSDAINFLSIGKVVFHHLIVMQVQLRGS